MQKVKNQIPNTNSHVIKVLKNKIVMYRRGIHTCFIPCCALSGWLALMLCFVRFASHEAKDGGTAVRARSVFTSTS